VGCCDTSVGKHATKHFEHTGHPVMQSIEPGEHWRWCYVDEETV
jgi:CPA1 family monovalent cation:H+ antiporter